MIVFINGPVARASSAVAARLAARWSGARVIDAVELDAGLAELASETAAPRFDGARARAKLAQIHPSADAITIVSLCVTRFAALRTLRRELGEVDPVIYAFRLRPHQSTLSASDRERALGMDREARAGDLGHVLPEGTSEDAERAAAFIDEDIHEPVHVVSWEPRWLEDFAAEHAELAKALSGIAERIEHVGSTAIVGIAAKPIIDIALVVREIAALEEYLPPLAELGYVFLDYPTNVTRYFFKKGRPRTHHLHVGDASSPEIAEQIVFRDMLIQRSDLRERYAALKEQLRLAFGQDRARYSAAKGDFVREVLALAAAR